MLGSLHGLNRGEAKERLGALLRKHPKILSLLPQLIAERVDRNKGIISIFDLEAEKYKEINFKPHLLMSEEIDQVVEFCEKTGLLEVLINVQNLRDYLFGVEVGIDTNSRKGRSGVFFQKMVEKVLSKNIPEYIRVSPQDNNFSLYKALGKTRRQQAKKHDFVLYKGEKPIIVIEVNFYNDTGSKPIEIVRSYITLNRIAKEKGVTFVWITDGPAWKKIREPLRRGMKEIEWVVNYSQLPELINYFNSINWHV